MRACAFFGLVLLGIALLTIPAATRGQLPPSDGDGSEGGGGTAAAQDDARAIFEYYAKGRSYFLVSETADLPVLWNPLALFALQRGNNTGQITREEFGEFMRHLRRTAGAMRAGAQNSPPELNRPLEPKSGAGSPSAAPDSSPSAPSDAAPSAQQKLDAINKWADADFDRRDANGDGKLNADEMPGSLKSDLEKWDTDGDGLIDAGEYRAYVIASRRPLGGGRDKAKPIDTIQVEEDDWDQRVNVMRQGRLPKSGLPTWFTEADTDRDGQVSLFEWRKAGMPLGEFHLWDEDDDGFITPTEAIKQQALRSELKLDGRKVVYESSISTDDPRFGGKRFHKMCLLKMEAGKTFQIDLAGKGFDAFLILQDPDGNIVAEDDDSGGNLNAKITYKARQTGKYRILATSPGPGEQTGPFTLTVRRIENPPAPDPAKAPVQPRGINLGQAFQQQVQKAAQADLEKQQQQINEQLAREEKQRREQKRKEAAKRAGEVRAIPQQFIAGEAAPQEDQPGEQQQPAPEPAIGGQAATPRAARIDTTQILPLSNAKAADIHRLLGQLYTQGAMSKIRMAADERTNSLVAYGPEELLAELRRVVTELDRPVASK